MTDDPGLDIDRESQLPTTFERFTERFPAVAKAHASMGKATTDLGPLDRRTCELVKIGVAAGAGLESATKSHARRALDAGASRAEVEQAVLQGMNTIGFPATIRAWVWASEQLDQEEARGQA